MLARLARLVRLFFVSKGARQLGRRLGSVGLFSVAMLLFCSWMAYVAEHPANPEFATFGDSLWWGIVTLTTVGYGDIVPKTEKGRLAGVFLMLTGVATLGVISGTLASAFRSSSRAAAAEDAADQADEAAVDEARPPTATANGRRPPTTCRHSWPTCGPTSSCSSSTSRRSSSAAARRRRASAIVRCCRAFPAAPTLVAMTMTSDPPAPAPAPKAERWTAQWKELYAEVITTGLCTGCAGCVVTCPHDVIGYEHEEGKYLPFHLEEELGLDNCIHGEKGCTTCTRACPRFRAWEPAADLHLFGRVREPDEMAGIWRQLLLTRAVDTDQQRVGQDGGFVSAMLIWLLEHDYIEAALVSGVEPDDAWKAKPVLARTKEEVLATAGSRYTYCANPLALRDAKEAGLSRLALVGMGCQTSSPPVMWDRKAGKVSRPFLFNIGLLCSKTFDDAIFPELFEAKYGLKKADMVKMNIKGVFQIWMKDGSYHEIDLKECHAWTRQGCKSCPDFAAEHSDIATGGIGEDNDWTLTIVRTELGEEVISRMIADGVIISRPAQEDEKAMKLLRLLSIVSRRRWPEFADAAPKIGVPPPKKKAPAPDAAAPARRGRRRADRHAAPAP